MSTVPIRYVGNDERWSDHLYGTGLTFERHSVTLVPDWAAESFLRHTEFVDARSKAKRGEPITVTSAKPVDLIPEEEQTFIGQIPIDNMTLQEMHAFAQRNFGVRLDDSIKRDDAVSEVRNLVGLRTRS